MGLGVLEDSKLDHVPGTVVLNDEVTADGNDEATAGLKHGTGRDAHIVLNPQPSDDPNDPLNWAPWRKQVIISILIFGGLLNCGVNGPLLNASYSPIAAQIHKDLASVVLVSGYNLLIAGAAGPFVCALSRKYGKRPVYLASTLLTIVGTAVGESRPSYEYLLAARIIQGVATATFESLLYASVGDLFYVHERGARIAAINFMENAASCLATIVCGQVFADLGLLWLFHLFQVFLVAQWLLMFFFCPETTYLRDVRYDLDVGVHRAQPREDAPQATGQEKKATGSDKDLSSGEEQARSRSAEYPPRKSFVQELAIYTGKYHDDGMWKDIFGPFLIFFNPAAAYAVLGAGILNAWYVGTSIIQSQVFSGAPWHYGPAQVGYVGTGPFIGGLLGSLVTMFAGDPVIKWLGRKNKGVYEPEFRLVFMGLSAIGSSVGMFLFGYGMGNGLNSVLCAFFGGIQMFGILIGIWSSFSYALDAFRNLSSEMFILNMVFKNFIYYVLSRFATDWVSAKGPEQMMYVFGGTGLFLCLLAVPVYIFGKRMRAWWSRHDLFVVLKMEKSGPVVEMG